jgi:hypothetical protein
VRRLVVLLLVLLGACAGGPRDGDREPSPLPPPRLEDAEVVGLAQKAAASAATVTTLMSVVGKGPLGHAIFSNLIPWRELSAIDEQLLYRGFARPLGVDVVYGVASTALAVDVMCFAHRAAGGAVSVEYSFDFLVLTPGDANPWTRCFVTTKEGGRGEVQTQALSFHDLDVCAAQAATAVTGWLREDGLDSVHVEATPRTKLLAVTVAFEDRVRQALIERGITLVASAKARRRLELDVNLIVSNDPAVVAAGAIGCDFYARLQRSDSTLPGHVWEQHKGR